MTPTRREYLEYQYSTFGTGARSIFIVFKFNIPPLAVIVMLIAKIAKTDQKTILTFLLKS